MSYTIKVDRLPEQAGPGRLGRHVRHDSRSLAYAEPSGTTSTVLWSRHIPILDQGDLGSCTGNATVGALGSGPLYDALTAAEQGSLDEKLAVSIYSAGTKLDSDPDNYPPTDTGCDGLSVAKATRTMGLISGYTHCLTVDTVCAALQAGPVITGIAWHTGFDDPDPTGRVRLSGGVRGGHEFVIRGWNQTTGLFTADNSWGVSYGDHGSFYFSADDYAKLLADDGDATSLKPLGQPAPQPAPQPADNDDQHAQFLLEWEDRHQHAFFYKDLQAENARWLKARA